jgi:hypothetical protein
VLQHTLFNLDVVNTLDVHPTVTALIRRQPCDSRPPLIAHQVEFVLDIAEVAVPGRLQVVRERVESGLVWSGRVGLGVFAALP